MDDLVLDLLCKIPEQIRHIGPAHPPDVGFDMLGCACCLLYRGTP